MCMCLVKWHFWLKPNPHSLQQNGLGPAMPSMKDADAIPGGCMVMHLQVSSWPGVCVCLLTFVGRIRLPVPATQYLFKDEFIWWKGCQVGGRFHRKLGKGIVEWRLLNIFIYNKCHLSHLIINIRDTVSEFLVSWACSFTSLYILTRIFMVVYIILNHVSTLYVQNICNIVRNCCILKMHENTYAFPSKKLDLQYVYIKLLTK